ncbi:hypothetical protein AK830_g2269 [Neonectria ditissima]|uniref:Uncharacterized protein n=1 Tax=Neonectria ditissima TaxID=78410 RepID=A0A0P7BUX0_9HYPO|nr:hypothetical protein AK830_g2269 [Neonectria ditissima]
MASEVEQPITGMGRCQPNKPRGTALPLLPPSKNTSWPCPKDFPLFFSPSSSRDIFPPGLAAPGMEENAFSPCLPASSDLAAHLPTSTRHGHNTSTAPGQVFCRAATSSSVAVSQRRSIEDFLCPHQPMAVLTSCDLDLRGQVVPSRPHTLTAQNQSHCLIPAASVLIEAALHYAAANHLPP